MKDYIFTISVDSHNYKIVLPNYETDYIQGMLAKNAKPYELIMLQAMVANLSKNDLVLDIGANIGNHSLYLAKVGGCNVVAFEPNPDLCKPFKKSIELNSLQRKITLYEVGLGEEEGKAHFAEYMPENLGAQSLTVDASEVSCLPIITLDSLNIKEKVRAIKIDVEGMELAVLRGGSKLVNRDKPYLFLEAQTEAEFNTLYALVKNIDYVYWDTFNATPTHWFVHKEQINEKKIISHYIKKSVENNKRLYTLRNTQKKLKEINNICQQQKIKLEKLNSKVFFYEAISNKSLKFDFSIKSDDKG